MAENGGAGPSRSVKELKAVIAEAGLTTAGCVEKSDLVKRAEEAEAILRRRQGSGAGPAASGSRRSQQIGVYECIVLGLEDGRHVDGVVVLLHGFGARSSDFVPLHKAVNGALGSKNVVFVLPQAPVSAAAMGSAAWWEIDVVKWMGAMQLGEAGIARLIRDKPAGLDECRRNLTEMLKGVRELVASKSGIADSGELPMVVGGFSQGGISAADVVLHAADHLGVDHVMMLSSAPIVVDEWADKLQLGGRGKRLKVLITHGHTDMVLPFQASGWARDLFSAHGATVRYESHAGGHELGGDGVLRAICEFVEEAIGKGDK